MFNTVNNTLQKFSKKQRNGRILPKAWRGFRAGQTEVSEEARRRLRAGQAGAREKHLLSQFSRQRLTDFLNRYSVLFHYLMACGICFVIEVISRHSFGDAFAFMFDRGLAFLYNSLLVFFSFQLVYFFRRRALMRTLISVLWLFLGTINGCVLLKRVTPFTYTDMKLINDLFAMKSNYFSTGRLCLSSSL